MSPSPSPGRDFLRSRPVPPAPSAEFDQWLDACRALGPESAPALLDALEHGDEGEQYGAVVCLRQFGYEAWAEGYGEELRYTVRFPDGEEKLIEPDQR
ncbi:hypothetical protein Airi01_050560 [Actinoallomurus iriomotensis]|uniref:Uncharacterized protein n=1 Tax=Actinoallomurus iriomotensis TaxID=478107 RepID=A0A9W6RJ78_9ACTN|nr:hypothetical protein Airi01_050560 [Actinoallomurus iriomotensis]